jgi:polyphosphate kinase 2
MNKPSKKKERKNKNKLTPVKITNSDFDEIKSAQDLEDFLKVKGAHFKIPDPEKDYEYQLKKLQVELVKLQSWIIKNQKRVIVIFEGRDASGKGGAIKRFTEHLNPRAMRIISMPKPTELEKKQWYFRKYIQELPEAGEIVFFDRSWYNRAVVEPVMEFCSPSEYDRFMRQVSEFEHMLFEDGVSLVKLWYSITKEEQLKRFSERKDNPLKRWKFSPVDEMGQQLWDKYTYYKEQMFSKTHTSFSPWIIVKTNDKKTARLESIRYLLSSFEYDDKLEASTRVLPDPNVIMRFHQSFQHID